jgi:hypothetical protein
VIGFIEALAVPYTWRMQSEEEAAPGVEILLV